MASKREHIMLLGDQKATINVQMAASEDGMVPPLSGILKQAPQSLFVGLLFSGQHLIDAEHLGLRILGECSFAQSLCQQWRQM